MTTACGNNQMGDPRVCMECLMPSVRVKVKKGIFGLAREICLAAVLQMR